MTAKPQIDTVEAAPDPDWLGEVHPDIVTVYRYWREKAAGRVMPARADIDPADLVRYLPSLMLVDVVPGAERPHYTYRLVGTREVAVRGSDPTGKPVATHCFGRSAADAFENYDRVVASRAPRIDRAHLLSFDAMILDGDKLFLPLSGDGLHVDMILVFTVQEKLR
ncbi:PAS domain-containing protein [Dongia sp.]|uniref:PAS domain-containing protein n=1 Tax=Dongia sp. TaxID=1977262 RepID=UPI0035B0A591